MSELRVLIGCAGWSIHPSSRADFPRSGSHLERYASCFSAVEINSTFYRPHRPATYARWAETVGPDFSFSVKMPRAITHDARLSPERRVLESFLSDVSHLGPTLGCLLIQLPPSLRWDAGVATAFFQMLREIAAVPVACEPRHESWFTREAEEVFQRFHISRVIADPSYAATGNQPGGWSSPIYYRLHGSPRVYYSSYDAEFLARLAEKIERHLADGRTCWCIFDNTAAGAASRNALDLLALLRVTPSDQCRVHSVANV